MDVWEYVPPKTESEHLKPLQEASRERHTNTTIQAQIKIALNNPGQGPEFLTTIVEWAQKVETTPTAGDAEAWMRAEAIVSAAMIAARDGAADLIAAHGTWIRDKFKPALNGTNDPVRAVRSGLAYNPVAIAFVGMVMLLKNRFDMEDVRTILEAAGHDDPAPAQGLPLVAVALSAIDERLPRSVLRCAFTACVHPHRQWDRPEEEYIARAATHRQQVTNTINAEFAWLNGSSDEPDWPEFEPRPAHPRAGLVVGRGRREICADPVRSDLYTNSQAAALWLKNAASIFDVLKRPWLRDVAEAYSSWTWSANGFELDEHDRVSNPPREWNDAYFNLLAHCVPGLASDQLDDICLTRMSALPEDAFFDIVTTFLRSVDAVYFGEQGLTDSQAVHIRTVLGRRLMMTSAWKWQQRERSFSIGMHLSPAIAVVAFNDYGYLQPTKCYLFAKGIDRLTPFLPLLEEIAENGSFLFVAIVLLNLLEVAPQPSHLPLITAASKAWLNNHPDDRNFWIDQGIGRRVCSLLQAIFAADPKACDMDSGLRTDLERVLANLVRLGVPEAHGVETLVISGNANI